MDGNSEFLAGRIADALRCDEGRHLAEQGKLEGAWKRAVDIFAERLPLAARELKEETMDDNRVQELPEGARVWMRRMEQRVKRHGEVNTRANNNFYSLKKELDALAERQRVLIRDQNAQYARIEALEGAVDEGLDATNPNPPRLDVLKDGQVLTQHDAGWVKVVGPVMEVGTPVREIDDQDPDENRKCHPLVGVVVGVGGGKVKVNWGGFAGVCECDPSHIEPYFPASEPAPADAVAPTFSDLEKRLDVFAVNHSARLDTHTRRLNSIEERIGELRDKARAGVAKDETGHNMHQQRLNGHDERINGLEQRLDAYEERMRTQSTEAGLTARVNGLDDRVEDHHERLASIDNAVSVQHEGVKAIAGLRQNVQDVSNRLVDAADEAEVAHGKANMANDAISDIDAKLNRLAEEVGRLDEHGVVIDGHVYRPGDKLPNGTTLTRGWSGA